MPRSPAHTAPLADLATGTLTTLGDQVKITLDTEAWRAWLGQRRAFVVAALPGQTYSVRWDTARQRWRAYRALASVRVIIDAGEDTELRSPALAALNDQLWVKLRSRLTTAQVDQLLAAALRPLAPLLRAEQSYPELATTLARRAPRTPVDEAALRLAVRLLHSFGA